jgi:hypothetical protein
MFVYRQELPVIAKNSLRNCHVVGMDSVMFDNTPGKRVRAYIAQEYNELWRNGMPGEQLSLAIHPHHCDIELDRIYGYPQQVIPVKHPGGDTYAKWWYRSEITQGNGGFIREADTFEKFKLERFPLKSREPWYMAAKDIHSFYVEQFEEAAWMVREFKEDTSYEPFVWSDADLSAFTTNGLYLPMDVDYLKKCLNQLRVNIIG